MKISIKPFNPGNHDHLELVAQRMQLTLKEVVDAELGDAMYSIEWLRARVLFHLDAAQCCGAVFLAWRDDLEIIGHTLLRVEHDDEGHPYGLFSTFYVTPETRRLGVGAALVNRGEAWFREQGLHCFATNTASGNHKLIHLLEQRGYRIELARDAMVHLRCNEKS